MRIDIIEVENKKNKTKTVVVFIIILSLIAIFSMLGILCAQNYKDNYVKNNNNQSEHSVEKQKNETQDGTNSKENTDKNKEYKTNNINIENKIGNIYNKDSKIAYLTFDDGPSETVTPLILDVLKKENIKATFFVLGTNVKKNSDILKRAYEEGHYIANHGYSHNYSNMYKNAKNVLDEYNKTEKLISQALDNKDYKSNLFRFPGGSTGGKYEKIKSEAGKLLNNNGILYIDWNVLTGDSQGANTKEKILKNVKKYTKDKGNIVVLMHDSSSKILTYEVLEDIIEYLKNQGYTFENFYSIMQ